MAAVLGPATLFGSKIISTISETNKASAHRTSTSSVRLGCASCHIPEGLVAATYAHAVNGASVLWGEFNLNYEDPEVWNAEKPRFAYAVRDWLRDTDSATCRACDEEQAIAPVRKRGQRQHKTARETGMTCIDCHYNLVHDKIDPRETFLDAAEAR